MRGGRSSTSSSAPRRWGSTPSRKGSWQASFILGESSCDCAARSRAPALGAVAVPVRGQRRRRVGRRPYPGRAPMAPHRGGRAQGEVPVLRRRRR
ncbi:hypothetical protein C2845_PM02G41080 [Panicum miliaceum]|uniref:Uncharacterized protein n=1 Tax=Panicum miliaceum TaxID=4540 RepID=A0A3L6S4F4_PANMI|nr:hypothetical protein C2845_PM02G41080 [Panicum miliaceum]